MAAPAACRQRKPISVHRLGLSAQARLAIVKMATPATKLALVPNLSARRPEGMSSAPKMIA